MGTINNYKNITIKTSPCFIEFLNNNTATEYIQVGAYGSGKSYAVATKIILDSIKEKRLTVVVRQVYNTIAESCFSVLKDVVTNIGLKLANVRDSKAEKIGADVIFSSSPLTLEFRNGSRIIARSGDNPQKLKSINNVSSIWIEELAEFEDLETYRELKLRLRGECKHKYIVCSFNPVALEHPIRKEFFKIEGEEEEEKQEDKINLENFYNDGIIIKNNKFYQHTVALENSFLEPNYIKTVLETTKQDRFYREVALKGKFAEISGNVFNHNFIKVLQEEKEQKEILTKVGMAGRENLYFGMDFGYAESYNALLEMAYVPGINTLVILKESYANNMLDNEFLELKETQEILRDLRECNFRGLDKKISGDNAEPKTIAWYRSNGVAMRPAIKGIGSRVENMKKIKRFNNIFILSSCVNTIAELKGLKYKKGATDSATFATDPHTLSAIWYGLDKLVL